MSRPKILSYQDVTEKYSRRFLDELGFDIEDGVTEADILFAMGGDPFGYDQKRADAIWFED